MLKIDWDDLADNGQKGDWYFHHDDTHITIRYGDGRFDVVTIPIARLPGEKHWQWNGNKEAPTITPSIAVGSEKQGLWHGWLRDGQLITA